MDAESPDAELGPAYAEAWEDWARAADSAWQATIADGLDAE